MKPLTIVKLTVKDFKRITAVEIEPKSTGLVRLRGRNAQGKSSLLDAIDSAICGKRVSPGQPVRAGADRAEVTIDAVDVRIRRRWTAGGGMTFKIESKDPNQPQTQGALDRLYKQISVDPVEFIRMSDREQAAKLRAAIGIDTEAMDAARLDVFNERTAVGRERDRLDGAFKLAELPDGPEEPVDVASLLRQHEEMQATAEANRAMRGEAAEAERARLRIAQDVATLESQLAEARRQLAAAAERAVTLATQAARLVDPDPEPVRAQIANSQATNKAVAARKAYRELSRLLGEKDDEYDRLTKEIEGIDAEKERMLAEARFPIPGVRMQGDTITLNHVPIDQASQAERLRFAVALAIALKPDMPVILIRDGSLLDDDSMRALEEMAINAGAQIWIEEVGTEAGDDAILIEDGALVEVAS